MTTLAENNSLLGGFKKAIGSINEKKHKIETKNNPKKGGPSVPVKTSNLLNKRTSFAITEAYKTARTNIMFATAGTPGCKKIIITSSEPGEGKSTTTLNLAITFAQTGAKVLIMDCDLRKPRSHRYLGFERRNGLTDLLIGSIDVKTAIKHNEEYNVDLISAGRIPPNPVELLSSTAMLSLLLFLSDSYDYILIDTPPCTLVTDASALATFVDGYVIVVRQNYTIHELLQKTRDSLQFANGKILGYLVNDMKAQIGIGYSKYVYSRYHYRYRYRYNYKYGYRYGGYGYNYGYNYSYSYSDRPNGSGGYGGYADYNAYGKKTEMGAATAVDTIKGVDPEMVEKANAQIAAFQKATQEKIEAEEKARLDKIAGKTKDNVEATIKINTNV